MPVKKKTAAKSKITNADRQALMTTLSSLMSRSSLAAHLDGKSFDGNRDLYSVLGYETNLTFRHFLDQYDRGDIATRIIDAPPKSTWRRKPVISNDDNPDQFTPFETEWSKLERKRRIFHYMERVDKLAGVGRYGALLIGTDDVRKQDDFSRPMAKLKKGVDSILYLVPYMEGSATVSEYDEDPKSERFGLPESYNIAEIGKPTGDGGQLSNGVLEDSGLLVHWSRVIHVAEGLRENDWEGTPRLQHVYNRLHDVSKIAGGSAEIFWQAAKRIMVLTAKDGFSAVDEDDSLTEMMDELIHGLRRVIDLEGYEAKTLDPTMVQPDETFRVCLALISSATGIPQRILLGSEQGKMASTQDEANWNGLIADRQINYAEPTILRPFIDRMILAGALPNPGEGYTVTWPSLFELSDKEKAQIGLLKARTIAAYVGTNGGNASFAEKIVPVDELRGELLNLRSRKIETSGSSKQADNPTPKTSGPSGDSVFQTPPADTQQPASGSAAPDSSATTAGD